MPIVEELAVDFAGKASIAKVNVDEEQELAAAFGIKSIPTLFIFKGKKLIHHMSCFPALLKGGILAWTGAIRK